MSDSKEPGQAATPASARRSRRVWKLFVLLAVAGGVFAAVHFLPIKESILAALQWTQGLGYWGPIFVVGFYILACVFLIPGTLITLAAGFLFGVLGGFITVSVGSTLGASVAFLVGRYLLRGWVEKRLATHPKLRAVDQAVGDKGLKIVILTRLSPAFPIPFILMNYGYGLTRVKFWKYMLGSWLGMMPGTLLYVYIGTLFRSWTELAAGKTPETSVQRVYFYIGLAITLVVVLFIGRVAQKAMKQAIPGDQDNIAAAAGTGSSRGDVRGQS
jgi:uncharacterized membrane protein YdjX (TVP38/TMEM64 family)